LSLLWRVLASPQTLIVLLGLVALAVVLGIVFPQMPLQAANDPNAWLAIQPGILGQASDLLYTVGLFDVYRAFWFHLLLALLGLTLFVWCVEAAGLAWKATVRTRWNARDFEPWGRRAPQIRFSTSQSTQTALLRVNEVLEQAGYGRTDVPGLPNSNQLASRRAFALWAEPVVYGFLLIALFGMAILGNWGWQAPDWQPAPGESHAIGQATDYVLRLDEFNLEQEKSGVTWLQDGVELGQGTVGAGQPIALPGVTVRQVGYVPVIRMRGLDDSGRSLAFQANAEGLGASNNIEVVFSSPDDQVLVLVLGHDRFLGLSFEPACTQAKPALRLVLLQAGAADTSSADKRAEALIHESGSVELEYLDIEIELAYRPILRAAYRPGAGLILAGVVLALIASVIGWLVRPRLLWVAVGTGEGGLTLVQVLALPKVRGSLWRQSLAARLGDRLSDDG
jgi:hypothetical protein